MTMALPSRVRLDCVKPEKTNWSSPAAKVATVRPYRGRRRRKGRRDGRNGAGFILSSVAQNSPLKD